MKRLTAGVLMGVALAAGSGTLAGAQPSRTRDDLLRVNLIDVGQGDCIWIQGPRRADGGPGLNVLIDGGPRPSSSERALSEYLEAYGHGPGSRIDTVIATHPHDDHYAGLLDILRDYEVAEVIDPGYPKAEVLPSGKPSLYGQFLKAVRAERVDGQPAKLVRLRDHDEGSIGLDWSDPGASEGAPQLKAEILAGFFKGVAPMGAKANTEENNASTVVRVDFGRISFLLMGDAEGKERSQDAADAHYVEELLLGKFASTPERLRSTVLKVAHHGSETSSTLPFMRVVAPDLLAVMSGRKRFGSVFLPDASVLQRYRAEFPALTIVRTDEADANERKDTTTDADGDDVYMYSDGASLRVYQSRRVNGKWRWVRKAVIQPPDPNEPD